MKKMIFILLAFILPHLSQSQDVIPFDTAYWDIQANGHVIANYQGQDALYLHQGAATVKDVEFLNGTIEYDIFITDGRGFHGVRFRQYEFQNAELFYIRPHQSGNVDANQATPILNGLTGWQLYFGPAYSFAHDYTMNAWTHVKLVVLNDRAQVFFDHATKPNLSWKLKNKMAAGSVSITASLLPMHYANMTIDTRTPAWVDDEIHKPEPIEHIIPSWTISDKFDEAKLDDVASLPTVIASRKWLGTVSIDENNAANISRIVSRPNEEGNTVFAKIVIDSDVNQGKLFEFGYSDRAVVLLNGQPIYRGDNGFRTRDYRYLGTIGLFDAVYLNLNKGKNELLVAVSERFGGWGVMGRFVDQTGIRVSN